MAFPYQVPRSSFISGSTAIYSNLNRNLNEERKILQDAQEMAAFAVSEEAKARIEQEAEEKTTVKCLLSLATPVDTDKSLDWIHVQTTNDIRRSYNLDEFVRYCIASGVNVPDPTRTLLRLNHMRKRALYIRNLPDDVRAITTAQLTDAFIDEKFRTLIAGWQKGYRSIDIPEFFMGIFMNISVWDRAGFIHDMDVGQSQNILINKPVGTWLLRKSSRSTLSSFRTVFTISFRTADSTHSIRLMLMHGIGVYGLTEGFDNMPAIYVSDEQLNEPDFGKMLCTLGYREPHFACITEMLEQLSVQNDIVLQNYITVSSLQQPEGKADEGNVEGVHVAVEGGNVEGAPVAVDEGNVEGGNVESTPSSSKAHRRNKRKGKAVKK